MDSIIKQLEEKIKKFDLKKEDLNILVIGPGYPKLEYIKRVHLVDKLKNNGWKKTVTLEQFRIKKSIGLDLKFNVLIELLSSRLLVLALFTKGGFKSGVEWEMGFLQGLYYGKFSKGKDHRHIEEFKKSVACLIEKGSEKYITPMIKDGGLQKLRNYSFKNRKEMVRRAESLALQRLKEL